MSTSNYVFHLGPSVFSWSSKKQQVVTLFIVEVGYIVARSCVTQAVWLRRMFGELQNYQNKLIKTFCDNKSAIGLTNTIKNKAISIVF